MERRPRPAVAAAVPPHSACDPGHRALTAPPAAPQGADELSNKIRELKEKEVDFYIVVQSACNIEQVMDTKTMTTEARAMRCEVGGVNRSAGTAFASRRGAPRVESGSRDVRRAFFNT